MIDRRGRGSGRGGGWTAFGDVQSGDAIRLCEGRKVEDVIHKGVDITAGQETDFSHMNEFRGPFADNLHAEEALPLGIGDEF